MSSQEDVAALKALHWVRNVVCPAVLERYKDHIEAGRGTIKVENIPVNLIQSAVDSVEEEVHQALFKLEKRLSSGFHNELFEEPEPESEQ